MSKNNNWQKRQQQGQNNNQQQPKVEQTAPLAGVVDSAPAVEYASEAELTSLLTLLDKIESSAQLFGDLAVETVSTAIADIRNNVITSGSLSEEDAAEIKKLEEEIALLEDEAGCNSPFTHISEAAYKALEEGTDEICVKWKTAQEMVREFGGDEIQQMSLRNYKTAVQQLAFQQVWAFVLYPIDMEGSPEAIVNIDTDMASILNSIQQPVEEPEVAQPAIAVV